MTQDTVPTVEELNRIQAEWMALDPHAPKAEQHRVLALMKKLPETYVSGHDGVGICMYHGGPTSINVPICYALSRCRNLGGRTDVAWNGKLGLWYSL
jgi:hypothetical protein